MNETRILAFVTLLWQNKQENKQTNKQENKSIEKYRENKFVYIRFLSCLDIYIQNTRAEDLCISDDSASYIYLNSGLKCSWN